MGAIYLISGRFHFPDIFYFFFSRMTIRLPILPFAKASEQEIIQRFIPARFSPQRQNKSAAIRSAISIPSSLSSNTLPF
jgi:hypothetical protein